MKCVLCRSPIKDEHPVILKTLFQFEVFCPGCAEKYVQGQAALEKRQRRIMAENAVDEAWEKNRWGF